MSSAILRADRKARTSRNSAPGSTGNCRCGGFHGTTEFDLSPGSPFHFNRWFEVTRYGYTADEEGNVIAPAVETADDEPR